MKEKRYYIAYGSNLNVRQMRMRCPHATILGTANLKGWELFFKGSKTGSYLTIEEREGGTVPVVIWEVTATDEAALDRYEGFPNFYYKKDIKLRYKGIRTGKRRTVAAFAYIMHEDRPVGIPSNLYMRTCLEGYDTFYFDKNILIDALHPSYKHCCAKKNKAYDYGHKNAYRYWQIQIDNLFYNEDISTIYHYYGYCYLYK